MFFFFFGDEEGSSKMATYSEETFESIQQIERQHEKKSLPKGKDNLPAK